MYSNEMELDKGIKVEMGRVKGVIFGGPFRHYVPGTRRLVGVKMAAEINHPHEFKVDTQDFSVPSEQAMQDGILYALKQLADGNDVYVGCMGGIGRTGLFMGCMAKVMFDYNRGLSEVGMDPVKYVRQHYKGHAIETDEQQHFVRTFNTDEAVAFLKGFNTVNPVKEVIKEVPVEKVVEKIVEKVVTKEVIVTPFDLALRFFGFGKR